MRFGDPETQAILPRLRTDLLELLSSACEPGGLGEVRLQWAPEPAVTVVLASAGYPQSSSSGDVISGLESVGASSEGTVYVNHAGTARDSGGRIVTAGGRVLCVTAVGGRFRCLPPRCICCSRHDRVRRTTAAPRHRPPGGRMSETAEGETAEGRINEPAQPAGEQAHEEVAETAAEMEDIDVGAPRVGIVMGSKSDLETMEKAAAELTERGIRSETRVMSAHRDPDVVADYARNARMRGLRVIIAGAGLSAALPGVVAAHTDLPVIGVPLTSRTSIAGGLDALLSITQMPPGVPVACVGVDNPRNAAVLAARILSA